MTRRKLGRIGVRSRSCSYMTDDGCTVDTSYDQCETCPDRAKPPAVQTSASTSPERCRHCRHAGPTDAPGELWCNHLEFYTPITSSGCPDYSEDDPSIRESVVRVNFTTPDGVEDSVTCRRHDGAGRNLTRTLLTEKVTRREAIRIGFNVLYNDEQPGKMGTGR